MAKLLGARVYNNAAIEIAHASYTKLTFNTERYDTDTIHSTLTNTGRLTCQTAGKYIITGQVKWEVNTTGQRVIGIYLNDATWIARMADDAISTWEKEMEVTTIYDLSIGNYVEIRVWQNSTVAIDVTASASIAPEFMMHRIG